MFSGIIEHPGIVVGLETPGPAGAAGRLTVDLDGLAAEVHAGESIAINGACLTVVAPPRDGRSEVAFDLLRETLERTNLGGLRPGTRVNLERSLQAGGRLDGHFVQGHVDGTGTVRIREPRDGQTWLEVAVPPAVLRYCVPKGSITIDGVSLTIVTLDADAGTLGVALIPTTLERTTLGDRNPGDRVNLEADMLGKHIVGYLDHLGLADSLPRA